MIFKIRVGRPAWLSIRINEWWICPFNWLDKDARYWGFNRAWWGKAVSFGFWFFNCNWVHNNEEMH